MTILILLVVIGCFFGSIGFVLGYFFGRRSISRERQTAFPVLPASGQGEMP